MLNTDMNMGLQGRFKKNVPYYCRRKYQNAIDAYAENTKIKYW